MNIIGFAEEKKEDTSAQLHSKTSFKKSNDRSFFPDIMLIAGIAVIAVGLMYVVAVFGYACGQAVMIKNIDNAGYVFVSKDITSNGSTTNVIEILKK